MKGIILAGGTGSRLRPVTRGIELTYATQDSPDGLAQAFLIGAAARPARRPLLADQPNLF